MSSTQPPWQLETGRLVISRLQATPDHAEFIVKLYNTPEFIAGEGKTGIDTSEKALKVLRSMDQRFEKYGHGVYLVSLRDSTPIGTVSLMRGDYTCPDIGFALLTEHTKQGYATEAAKLMMVYAQVELKYDGVFGFAAPDNASSNKALRRLGLEYRGVYPLEAFGGKPSAVYVMEGMGELRQYGIKGEKQGG